MKPGVVPVAELTNWPTITPLSLIPKATEEAVLPGLGGASGVTVPLGLTWMAAMLPLTPTTVLVRLIPFAMAAGSFGMIVVKVPLGLRMKLVLIPPVVLK